MKTGKKLKWSLLSCIVTASVFTAAGCAGSVDSAALEDTSSKESISTTERESAKSVPETKISATLDKIDASNWKYNSEDDVYWQVGISYCETPADAEYETLGIFVPGAYMEALDNGDGTYTCKTSEEGTVLNYTSKTAPIVVPVNTPGYSAMEAPTDYAAGVSDYTSQGFVYVYAGCRGRDAGAPAGVTDLKAAIRYVRYNEGNIPGSAERIFSFGMSGGGAQSALLGTTGDSDMYTPYLEAIGAVEGVSDAVTGSMCWCPITNLDYANEAYEWNLGSTRTGLEEEMQQLSDNMAEKFAAYLNGLGLEKEGNVLSLVPSDEGIYQAGSYYDHLKFVIEQSLNNFLQDTSFPYDASQSSSGHIMDLPEGTVDGERPERTAVGELPEGTGEGELTGNITANAAPDTGEQAMPNDNINRNETSGGITLTGTYETAQDYIDALNAETKWVTYDSETNTASISSIADFTNSLKTASKSVGAFDDLNASQGENTLFGYGDGSGVHFDSVMAELLEGNTEYGQAYADDLKKKDALGNTVLYRVNMYNPMYFISDYYEGYQSAKVADYFRIRTGINQGDTALTTEANLALALDNYGTNVDFETVWGQGHTEAERTGDATANFITWVNECLK